MKKIQQKIGNNKTCAVYRGGGPKRAHNVMKFFMKDQMFLFLTSAFSQNIGKSGTVWLIRTLELVLCLFKICTV